MYVLVPDDPVFFSKFQSLEEPLLRHLYRLHSEGLGSDDERIISDAYDSWVQVLLKLPLWSWWHTGETSADLSADRPRYALYNARGDQLTSLYPTELAAADLGHLTACLDLFVEAGRVRRGGRERMCAKPSQGEQGLIDVFRRVMDVLLLPPPEGLLDTLRHVVPQEVAVSVTLPEEREAEYWEFCEEIVTILSSGDSFAFRSHRAMYI
ncbi:hypothetical protein A6P39_043540 (plasmid) [Streptomyces sp. FXJ1.172]|uniref:hypothetical protein n=1 Tax=Streptomyces sp. FXJ1.172 TaxID=710705 RepID=UPI0023DD2FEC|nr:hypothetical protein [Streptomyces sp. FXJ1.172]WEP00605.1 hypothetical protein A6P39_043540 [Streptomyces sp. FXJ1.172]